MCVLKLLRVFAASCLCVEKSSGQCQVSRIAERKAGREKFVICYLSIFICHLQIPHSALALLFRLVDFCCCAVEDFRRVHHRLCHGRMSVDRFADVANFTSHLDCQHGFGDQFASSGTDDTTPEHTFGGRIDQPLRHAFGSAQRLSPTAGRPRIGDDLDDRCLQLSLRRRSALPTRFRDQ